MDRREFIVSTAGIAAGLALANPLMAVEFSEESLLLQTPPTTRKGDMPYRTLGRTGESVSLIGLGGYHIGIPQTEQESIRIIRRAVDNGITFMDNCWDYHDGKSEIWMGKALKDGYRSKVFLMTKIDGRDRRTAAKQIDESLHRLQTEYVDLMQLHEVIRMEGPDLIFNEGGALEAIQEAKNAGKIRYIGFTGHKDPLVHLRMLEVAHKHGFRFDAVQLPLNVMDAHFRSFQRQVLPELVRQEIGILGMKPMGNQFILNSRVVKPIECLHYAMTIPTSVVITGIESMNILDQAIEAARTFTGLSREQVSDLLARTLEAAQSGRYELYKTTAHFDGTARHPEWLGEVERLPS
jgi:predicted aldo/keto reductase-like oxidoreductase